MRKCLMSALFLLKRPLYFIRRLARDERKCAGNPAASGSLREEKDVLGHYLIIIKEAKYIGRV